MKRLSIIIPVYNVEAYLPECLDSIFSQRDALSDIEVILVNDGSPDGSAAILEEYRKRYDNITVITQSNQGLSLARMNGLERAQGDYVWFVDSDDYLADHAFEILLPLIQAPDAPSVIMTPIRRKDVKTGRLYLDYERDAPGLMDGPDVLLNGKFPSWTAGRYIVRRALYKNGWLRFPPGLLHEDEYFGAVLLMIAERVLVYDKELYKHRIRPGSIMQSISIRSSYDYVSNYALLKAFSETLPAKRQDVFLRHVQRLLPYSYSVNEKIWKTPGFRRFKRKKGPFILCEFIRSRRLYTFRELVLLGHFFVAPIAFRKRFPKDPRQ